MKIILKKDMIGTLKIGNKKAAITVMRPTSSFSLWEMRLQT
jgi:hypothetical protein